jgi:hypothetical protein
MGEWSPASGADIVAIGETVQWESKVQSTSIHGPPAGDLKDAVLVFGTYDTLSIVLSKIDGIMIYVDVHQGCII